MASGTWRRDAVLLATSMITIIGTTAIAAALPRMSTAFADVPDSRFLVQISLTLPALSAGLSAPLVGLVIDRWGRKPLFVVALIGYGLTGSAGAFLPSLPAILVSRFLLGISVAAITTCATALLADYAHSGQMSGLMGRQSQFMALGNVVFVFLGGVLASVDWRLPFLIYAVAFLILPGLILLVDEPPRGAPVAADHTPEPVAASSAWWIAGISAAGFLNMIVYFMIPVYLPFLLAGSHGGGSVTSGVLLSVVGIAWALSSMFYRHLAARLPYAMILALTFAVIGVADLILAAAGGYPLVIVALVLIGAALGCTLPNLNAWMLAVVPPSRKGRALGLLIFATFMGQFFSPVLTRPLVGLWGIPGSYRAAGIVIICAAVVAAVIGRRRRPAVAPLTPAVAGKETT